MAKPRKWNEEQLEEAVRTSRSLRQTLTKLGLREAGGNYASIKARIKEYDLDTSHWTGQAWLKGTHIRTTKKQRPLSSLLIKDSPAISSHALKQRLINESLLSSGCSICDISDWLGQPLALHLDHINGHRTDNRLDNLRLLCPNCHSQTETYCGKNIGRAS